MSLTAAAVGGFRVTRGSDSGIARAVAGFVAVQIFQSGPRVARIAVGVWGQKGNCATRRANEEPEQAKPAYRRFRR